MKPAHLIALCVVVGLFNTSAAFSQHHGMTHYRAPAATHHGHAGTLRSEHIPVNSVSVSAVPNQAFPNFNNVNYGSLNRAGYYGNQFGAYPWSTTAGFGDPFPFYLYNPGIRPYYNPTLNWTPPPVYRLTQQESMLLIAVASTPANDRKPEERVKVKSVEVSNSTPTRISVQSVEISPVELAPEPKKIAD